MTNANSTAPNPESVRERGEYHGLGEFAGPDEHPVLHIPFNVVIDGRSYAGAGLSLVLAFAKGLSAPQLEGQRRIAVLQFNFQGYSVNLATAVRIESASSQTGLLVLKFLDPTGLHLPQLRYLLNAFVAGDLVDVRGLLGAAGSKQTTAEARVKSGRTSMRMRLRRIINTLAILASSAALVAIVGIGAYERFFVHEAEGLSVVSADGMIMRAISAGQIDFVNASAKTGDPLLAIRAISGDVVTLSMPCDCRIIETKVVPGATVLAGEPLMQLVKADAKPVVRAVLGADAVHALAAGGEVQIEFADGRIAKAGLASAIVPAVSGEPDRGEVTLVPKAGVAMEDLGKPVTVRVLTSPRRIVDKAAKASAATLKDIGGVWTFWEGAVRSKL